MLTAVEIITIQGLFYNLYLSLPFENSSNGFTVQSIEGLDPVKATLVSSGYTQLDGAQYHSSKREPRNIKLRLGLEPDYITNSVSDLRKLLYSYCMPKTEVKLRFKQSVGPDLYIIGRVESFETVLFTKEPTVDISIMCFDPDFFDETSVVFESFTVSSPENEIINYEGSVETGFIVTLELNANANVISFVFTEYGDVERAIFLELPALTLSAGDQFIINTKIGEKNMIRVRSGDSTSLLWAMNQLSRWPKLRPGVNEVRFYADEYVMPYTIEYVPRYGGL